MEVVEIDNIDPYFLIRLLKALSHIRWFAADRVIGRPESKFRSNEEVGFSAFLEPFSDDFFAIALSTKS